MTAPLRNAISRRDLERFWVKVQVGGWDACWPWKASTHPDGYGQFVLGGRPVGAHRVAYAIIHNQWPGQFRISHRCGNPACVNPAHLLPEQSVRRVRSPIPAGRSITPTISDEERFWSKVTLGAWNDCWPWTASLRTGGYGSFWISQGNVGAHRVAFTLVHGPIPDDLCICHLCDNPPCVNPAHLFAGSHEDNQADKIRKKRHARGVNHGASRISFDIAAEIRELSARGVKQTVLADRFEVSRAAIHSILTNRVWRPA